MTLHEDGATEESMIKGRSWHRWFQFSVRSLLVLITLAAVACWWFLQPETRESQFENSPLRIRRQVQLRKVEPGTQLSVLTTETAVVRGETYVVVNAGFWQLRDGSGNLLVNGHYANDKRHGRWTTYHANGRKAADGRLQQGEKVGLWRTWDEEGKLLSSTQLPSRPIAGSGMAE